MPSPVIFGCSGAELDEAERQFFEDANPWGFILFSRNITDPYGVHRLTSELRDCVGRKAPVLIDQEGGAVSRLRPPYWKEWPAVGPFLASVDGDESDRCSELWERFRQVGKELLTLGIDVNCMPVLDLPEPGSRSVLGERALGDDPTVVAWRGLEICDALLSQGVLPIAKHMPGHGRTTVDSHLELPVVNASLEELEEHDFVPFRLLSHLPIAMTAHVVYTAIDPNHPATQSSLVVEKVMRDFIGFDGVILGDDICMGALMGSPEERALMSLNAGCDAVLHCDGDLSAMENVAECIGMATPEALQRMKEAELTRDEAQEAMDD